jgi:hypothetical protein
VAAADAAVGRRRFTVAAVVALALVAVPYVWTLWGPWESANPLRTTIYEDNFYDLQARAMFHGHLWLPKGSIGIEAFVHDGRQYTYFGLFPSLLRMPILRVTSRLDGRLTAPSMLLAWVATALFAALLVWRVRILLRGPVVMGWGEAIGRLYWDKYGIEGVALRIGSALTRPAEPRHLATWLGDDDLDDVDDPIGGRPEEYTATAAQIATLVEQLVALAWPAGTAPR